MERTVRLIAKILVPVTGSQRDGMALATAVELAKPFGSHVQAVFTWPDPQSAVPQVGIPFTLDVVEAICGGQAIHARASEKTASDLLASVSASKGVRVLDAPDIGETVSCSMRSETGTLPIALAHAAELADLVVFPPLRLPGFVDMIEAFLSVLTRVERPVVVASEAAPRGAIRSAAIAWNGSKPAARAVMAAMPFLENAHKVYLLEVAEPHTRPCIDGVEQYLALHGIRAIRKSARLGRSVGDMLAHEAEELGADLLVMGGYGHSHIRETFFGGVTADVLARASMPVFLAH
jgi:nucleotide-binding universal stress UspA family protein